MYRQEFINKLKEVTIKGWYEYKVLPSLTIAQAILETGWGKSAIGNNLFGIKADVNWKGKKKLVTTHEYVNGKKVYIDAYFRDYDTIYDSLKDRYSFLQKPRYNKVVGEKNYKIACDEIHKAGYATDIRYNMKLREIIEQYKLYEIDKQAMQDNGAKQGQVSAWARDSWAWCAMYGLLDGERPLDKMTREEFSIILMRMVNN